MKEGKDLEYHKELEHYDDFKDGEEVAIGIIITVEEDFEAKILLVIWHTKDSIKVVTTSEEILVLWRRSLEGMLIMWKLNWAIPKLSVIFGRNVMFAK